MERQVIREFHEKMMEEQINDNNIHESELKQLYKEVLINMTTDYSEYRKHMSSFLASLESNNFHSVPYSLLVFQELYEQLINTKDLNAFDLSIMEYDASERTFGKLLTIFTASHSDGKLYRLSEDQFDISTLLDEEKKEMAAYVINQLQDDSKLLNWNGQLVNETMLKLVFLRQVLNSLNATELFYFVIGLFFDRLSSSEYYQAGRDVAEEIIIASYKDNVPELGYFNAFRLYSNIGSIHASFLYANLSMISIFRKKLPYSEKYLKEIVWQSIKFFRNVHLYPWAIKIYKEIPQKLNFSGFERRSLDHTYFMTLLKVIDESLPSLLFDYLHKEREEILKGGISEALPWLLSLYNIRRLYPKADFTIAGLGFFLGIFEKMVPAALIKKQKDLIDGDSGDLKNHLKESLIKLNETRNITDFVYDNESAIRISGRLIKYSIDHKDASGFLLSMMLKSDYSVLFKPKESPGLSPLMLPEMDIETLETLYDDPKDFLRTLCVNSKISLIWLAYSEEEIFLLQLFNSSFTFHSLGGWTFSIFKNLIADNYFVDFSFSETSNDRNGVRLVSPEEFKSEEIDIANEIGFAKLPIMYGTEAVYVVKDMEISQFPHNLFLDSSNNFR